jgi:hypothetical protein
MDLKQGRGFKSDQIERIGLESAEDFQVFSLKFFLGLLCGLLQLRYPYATLVYRG